MRWALFLLVASCGGNAEPCPKVPPAPPCASAAPAPRAAMTPKELLAKMYTSPHVDPAWFQDAFLRAVPIEKIDTITQQVIAAGGALKEVRATDKEHVYEIVFEKTTFIATIILEDGRVQTLFIKPGETHATSLDEALAPFAAMPGKLAYVVLAGEKPIARRNETETLAVGSTFKLAVLAELRDRIEKQKKLAWDRVVPLDPKWKSLPSGILHEWPEKTPLTIQTLASLMISISDNTATDAVIQLLGRGSLGGHGAFQPFLTTAEMFRLKAKSNVALLERFRKATPKEREQMLDGEVAKLPLPKVEDYPTGVTAIDVEWTFSAADLCKLMARVRDLPLMSINPGVAKKSDWDRVAFKGGSEPGVINMTTWVEKGTKSYCVSATWNDEKPVDDARFALSYGAVLSFLAKSLP